MLRRLSNLSRVTGLGRPQIQVILALKRIFFLIYQTASHRLYNVANIVRSFSIFKSLFKVNKMISFFSFHGNLGDSGHQCGRNLHYN